MVFVFFQAEDGIRDLIVTGVQTCALPISVHAELVGDAERRNEGELLVELEARRLAIVDDVDPEGAERRDAGRHGGDEPHRERAVAGREHNEERADEGRPGDERQDRQRHWSEGREPGPLRGWRAVGTTWLRSANTHRLSVIAATTATR